MLRFCGSLTFEWTPLEGEPVCNLSQEVLVIFLPFPTFLSTLQAINKSAMPDYFPLSLRVSHHTAVINRYIYNCYIYIYIYKWDIVVAYVILLNKDDVASVRRGICSQSKEVCRACDNSLTDHGRAWKAWGLKIWIFLSLLNIFFFFFSL